MIAMFKRIIRSKKGLTLVEVIVASAISSIILIGALGFFIPTSANMKKIDDINNAKMLSQMIINGIEKQVKYASSVRVEYNSAMTPPLANNMVYQEADPTDPTLTMVYFTPDSGTTVIPLVDKGFYDNMRCETTFKVSSKGTLKVKVVAHLKNNMTPIVTTEAIALNYNGGANIGGTVVPSATVPPVYEGNYLLITLPAP